MRSAVLGLVFGLYELVGWMGCFCVDGYLCDGWSGELVEIVVGVGRLRWMRLMGME